MHRVDFFFDGKHVNLSTKGCEATFNYEIVIIEVGPWLMSPIVIYKHTAFYDEMRLKTYHYHNTSKITIYLYQSHIFYILHVSFPVTLLFAVNVRK